MSESHNQGSSASDKKEVRDVVCGMTVDPKTTAHHVTHAGKDYYFCSSGCQEKFNSTPDKYSGGEEAETSGEGCCCAARKKVKDPVCGMDVDPEKTSHQTSFRDKDYFFCSARCLEKFSAAPQTYLDGKPAADDHHADTSAIYTCPMHPEVEQVGPGSCPKCGMALEPRDGVTTEEDTSELDDMWRRFKVCAVLSLPVLILAMGEHLPGNPVSSWIDANTAMWIEFLLATPVMLWGAKPFFIRAWQSIVHRSLNMFTLIALGTSVAYLYSVIGLLFPHVFPPSVRMENGHVDVYFEAAAVIVTLVLLGQVMELRARSQTNSAIRALLDLSPKTARRINEDGSEEDVAADQVNPGDRLRVRPGESVPVDGEIIEGKSTLDESMISGESMPVGKTEGDKVTGGTLNQTGGFVMVATQVGSETVLARIVTLVGQAQRSRAPIQKMADMVAGYFVPAVVLSAIVTAIVWGVWGPAPALSYALVNAVAVLIIACPCAVGLATPMSIMVGTGCGAQAGILVKNAESLELMEKIDVLVIDKTGTLTEGRPVLTDVIVAKGFNRQEVLRLASALETGSEHPLAAAIVKGARDEGVDVGKASEFASVTGKGVTGMVEGRKVALGNDKLMQSLDITLSDIASQAENRRGRGETVMLAAIDGRLAGLICVSDPVKQSTPDALHELRKSGMRIVMLTGDNERTARAVADQLEIDEIEAGVLPERKSEVVKRLQSEGYKVAMAGDGVNDSPALAQADVGIAMGTGADIAMESAQVTLVKGDLTGIVRARRLSQKTMRNIRQNLFFAFIYNAAGIPIAAGVLYPFLGILLSPIIASLAMVCSSVSVILNSLRLRNADI